MSGTLYICGTPIGNLEDITLRQLRILREVDCIAAEDTRHTLKLLNYYDIKTPLTSYHEHNKRDKGPDLARQLTQGRNIALVTDAGMPCLSDPGQELVKLCREEGIEVTAVPGPTAAITALALSGMDMGRFVFEGFLPRENRPRRDRLEALKRERRTIVLYEAPHHIKATVEELLENLGNRRAALVREMTKKYEETFLTNLKELSQRFLAETPVGEMVLIIAGAEEATPEVKLQDISINEQFDAYLRQGMARKDAMKQIARERGIGKSAVYRELLPKNEANSE
jgi:16S rRNA (cytidine1402-2'-O)-methyltransferase